MIETFKKSRFRPFSATTCVKGWAVKFVAALSVSVVLPGVALFAATLTPLSAQAEVSKAACQVHVVEATTEGDGKIPAELEFMAEQLEGLIGFKGFRLLESKKIELTIHQLDSQKFKRHSLNLELLGGDKKLKLRANLHSATGKSLVGANYSIADNGMIMLPIVKKDKTGATVYAIRCHAKH